MSLTKDVQEAIEKNLPAAVAGTLKEFISQAEIAKGNADTYYSKWLQADKSRKEQEERALIAESKLSHLQKREQEIAGAEQKLLVAAKDVECARAVRDAVQGVVAQVFANAQIKRTVFESGTIPAPYGPSGQYPTALGVTSSRTESVDAQ